MITTNQTFETLSVNQLAPVTGGGIGATIGGMFGAKGQQWGAVADNILGMFQGGGGAGGLGGLLKMFGGAGSSGGSSGSSSAAPADASGGGAQ